MFVVQIITRQIVYICHTCTGYSELSLEVMVLAKTHPVQWILYITFRPFLLLEYDIAHANFRTLC